MYQGATGMVHVRTLRPANPTCAGSYGCLCSTGTKLPQNPCGLRNDNTSGRLMDAKTQGVPDPIHRTYRTMGIHGDLLQARDSAGFCKLRERPPPNVLDEYVPAHPQCGLHGYLQRSTKHELT